MRQYVFLGVIMVAAITGFAEDGKPRSVRKKFNGVVLGDKDVLLKKATSYRQKFTGSKGDTLFYKIEFNPLIGVETDLAYINEAVYIDAQKYMAAWGFSGKPSFQKVFDLSPRSNESWQAEVLFHHHRCIISPEGKIFDPVLRDSLFIFSIKGDMATSHTDYIDRIFVGKTRGIVRFDCTVEGDNIFTPRKTRAIFLSNDYVRRRKVKKFAADVVKR